MHDCLLDVNETLPYELKGSCLEKSRIVFRIHIALPGMMESFAARVDNRVFLPS